MKAADSREEVDKSESHGKSLLHGGDILIMAKFSGFPAIRPVGISLNWKSKNNDHFPKVIMR
jgi:hypothetical protein